jgi:hypothetical protein
MLGLSGSSEPLWLGRGLGELVGVRLLLGRGLDVGQSGSDTRQVAVMLGSGNEAAAGAAPSVTEGLGAPAAVALGRSPATAPARVTVTAQQAARPPRTATSRVPGVGRACRGCRR